MKLKDLFEDIIRVEDVLLVVKNGGVVGEIRTGPAVDSIREKYGLITIGENDGPCHMHIRASEIDNARFVVEEKQDRTSFSVRFFDGNQNRVLGAFFTKMYDENKNIVESRKRQYYSLFSKYAGGQDKPLKFESE